MQRIYAVEHLNQANIIIIYERYLDAGYKIIRYVVTISSVFSYKERKLENWHILQELYTI